MIIRYTSGFVFGSLLQKDLEAFVADWNNHRIRPNGNSASPSGTPNDMYDMPTIHGKNVNNFVGDCYIS